MQRYQNLAVWQKAHALVLDVYRATKSFPADERFAMTSQMRRASFSIAANIAEGCGRETQKELAQFFQIAMGSAFEVEYFFLLARDLEYLDEQSYIRLNTAIDELKRMLYAFLLRIRKAPSEAMQNE
jgi:four helix bundle protein